MNDQIKNDLHDEQLSNIYQQTRIEEPPMALDSAILAKARMAVERPAKPSLLQRFSWLIPVATAAVALLTVSLVIQSRKEFSEPTVSVMEDTNKAYERDIMAEKGDVLNDNEGNQTPLESKQVVAFPDVSAPSVAVAKAVAQPEKTKRILKTERRSAGVQQFKSGTEAVQTHRMASVMMLAEPEPSVRARTRDEAGLSINQWLKQIRTLIKEKRINEARQRLEAFRKTHQDYVLPKDIAAALN